MKFVGITSCTLLICMLLALPGFAAAEEQPQERKHRWTVTVSSDGAAGADLEEGGRMAVAGAALAVKNRYFRLKSEVDQFSWSDVGEMNFGNGQDDPWDRLYRISAGTGYRASFSQLGLGDESSRWGVMANVGASLSFEEEIDESYGLSTFAGLTYTATPKLWLAFGGGGTFNRVDKRLLPFASLRYNGRDQDGRGFFVNVGFPRSNAGFAFSPKLEVYTGFKGEGGTYRLADDSTVSPQGFAKLRGYSAVFKVQYKPLERLTLIAGPKYVFGREIEILDSDGDELSETNVDGTPGGELSLAWKF